VENFGVFVVLLLHERGDQVLNGLFILYRVCPPVIDDETQVGLCLGLVLDLVVYAKSVSHDGNQHVKQMDQK